MFTGALITPASIFMTLKMLAGIGVLVYAGTRMGILIWKKMCKPLKDAPLTINDYGHLTNVTDHDEEFGQTEMNEVGRFFAGKSVHKTAYAGLSPEEDLLFTKSILLFTFGIWLILIGQRMTLMISAMFLYCGHLVLIRHRMRLKEEEEKDAGIYEVEAARERNNKACLKPLPGIVVLSILAWFLVRFIVLVLNSF